MADPQAGNRWRRDAHLARGERRVLAAVREAMAALAAYARGALRESGLDPAVLDDRAPAWRDALTGEVTPAIYGVFADAWGLIDRGTGIDPTLYGTRHLEGVWNRLVGASDEVFDRIRGVIEAGRQEGLHPSQVARDVDAMLADTANWEGRARTIARTETLAANNAGARASARVTAEYLGYSAEDVQRVWLATGDSRTRETHLEADGQVVYGSQPYVVGGADLEGPGDPAGPAEEVVNCRCTEQFYFPGDPEYDSSDDRPHAAVTAEAERRGLAAAGTLTAAVAREDLDDGDDATGLIVCALPAETDPVHGIGPEPKHATILFYGDMDDLGEQTDPDTLRSIVAGYASITAPFIETVTGVDSLGDDGARVLLLDPEGTLAYIYSDLPDYDSEAQPEVEQFPTYTPHVTLGYPEPGDDRLDDADETAAGNVQRITFDRLAVWAGPEQYEYPLTGDAGDDTTAQEASVNRSRLLTRGTAEPLAVTVDRLVASGFFPNRDAVVRHLARAMHQPIGRLTAAAGDPAPVPVEPEAEDLAVGDEAPVLIAEPGSEWGPNPDRFHGIATVEDEQTGDGRVFAPGAIYWDDAGLPMPLGVQFADAPGHDGAVIAGRIDTWERSGNAITYTGTWDLDGAGWEARRLVAGQFLRGISVDTDDSQVAIVNADGTPLDGFDMFMPPDADAEPPIMLVQRSRLRSATLCRVPAFAPSGTEGAYIANGLPEDLVAAVEAGVEAEAPPEDEAVVAALVASAVALDLPAQTDTLPPAEWFSDPGLERPTPITITDDGRIFGHLAAWGTCHIGVQGTCVTPPHSQTDYAHFAHGVTQTTGGPVITGLLTMDTGHAAPDLRALPAAAHYDDTGTQFATVAVGEDALGIWVAGAVLPEVTPEQIAKVNRAGALSGDWRRIRGNLELVAALAVNTPGFPIPRLSLAASAVEGQTALIAAGIVTRDYAAADGLATGSLTMDDVRAMVASALSDERAAEARRGRIARASATLRRSRATAAAARIGG